MKQNFTDYEISSECRVTGILEYSNNDNDIQIKFKFLTLELDQNGLHRYSIKVTINTNQGHHSKLSSIYDLLELLAVYFGCRFFLHSCTSNEVKYRLQYSYNKCRKELLPTIFDHFEDNQNAFQQNRIFDGKLHDFLDKFDKLEPDQSSKFLRACNIYSSALKEVGLKNDNPRYDGYGDQGRMSIYLKLITAIEVFLPRLNKVKDKELKKLEEKYHKEILELIKSAYYNVKPKKNFHNCEEKKRFDNINKHYQEAKQEIEQQSITRSLKDFILEHSKQFEYIKSEKLECKNMLYVYQEDLEKLLGEIYNARSRRDHGNTPMTLSPIMYNSSLFDWHCHPSLSPKTDKESQEKRLPYEWWFERLVRHCLLEYFKSIT